MIGFSFTQNNIEYVIVLPSVTYTSGNKVVAGSQELEIYDSTVMASLETAIAAYQPGGSGGDYSQGYADGQSAMESIIASSQAITANLYKSKLASEDATIAAADATDIDGQGTIFTESYSYLKTSAEMQANYDSGYTAGETAGYSAGEAAGYTSGYSAGYSAGEAAAAGTPFTKDNLGMPAVIGGYYMFTHNSTLFHIFSNSTRYRYDNVQGAWVVQNYTSIPGNFNGGYVWHVGNNTYYSSGTTQVMLDYDESTHTAQWTGKSWNGLSNFTGIYIWTDGTNIYYSSADNQYVLHVATSTWNVKTWSGVITKPTDGREIWTDGTNIYYSSSTQQYVLDVATSTWASKTWNGLTNFAGRQIWTDGTNIYYSNSTAQYVLDVATSTWTAKTWNGLTSFNGNDTYTIGNDIYYSHVATGQGSPNNWKLDKQTSTWTQYNMAVIGSNAAFVITNGTVYSIDDIDMSFKPKSNNP